MYLNNETLELLSGRYIKYIILTAMFDHDKKYFLAENSITHE